MDRKIKIAFVKFGGMSIGGTEKLLQTIAANLSKADFEVDYFYCDSAPYLNSDYVHLGTNEDRLNYTRSHGVNLIEFKVGAKDIGSPTHDWIDTNFWDVFDESRYDIIQTGRAGHPEYPFHKIRKTPIVDSIHLEEGVDNQFNISRVMHLNEWSAKRWIRYGGDAKRVVLISIPMDIRREGNGNLRASLGLEGKFVYGFHQRADDTIFSGIPLAAYRQVEDKDTAFVLLGGGARYRQQAKELGLKNVVFLEPFKEQQGVYDFLSTLDVFAHGRLDGEVNSSAMAEAMYFKLPIVSHFSKVNNGHVSSIGEAGKVVRTINEFAAELRKLREDKDYYAFRSAVSGQRFAEKYELGAQMRNIENIYREVVADPFPHPWHRVWSRYSPRYLVWYPLVRMSSKLKRGFRKARRMLLKA